MNQQVVVRDEIDADVSAITEVTIAAFKTLEISNKTEQYIIEALRAAKALIVSLVCPVSFMKECHRKHSSLVLSLGIRLKAVSRSMRVSIARYRLSLVF